MAVLIIFTVIGVITSLLGLFFFGLRIVESILVELRTFRYKIDKHIVVRKEDIDEKIITKKQRLAKIRDKQDELKDIKNDQKMDKVEKKILLEKTKNPSVVKVKKIEKLQEEKVEVEHTEE